MVILGLIYGGNCRILEGTFWLHPLLRVAPCSRVLLGTSSERWTEQLLCARQGFASSLVTPGGGCCPSFQMRKLRLRAVEHDTQSHAAGEQWIWVWNPDSPSPEPGLALTTPHDASGWQCPQMRSQAEPGGGLAGFLLYGGSLCAAWSFQEPLGLRATWGPFICTLTLLPFLPCATNPHLAASLTTALPFNK